MGRGQRVQGAEGQHGVVGHRRVSRPPFRARRCFPRDLKLMEKKDEAECRRCWSGAERALHTDTQPGEQAGDRHTESSNSGISLRNRPKLSGL